MATGDDRLKQRIVGAVVLTALAILILPMLLDGSAGERERVLSGLPDAPVILAEDLKMEDIVLQMEKMDASSSAGLPVRREPPDQNRESSEAGNETESSDKGSRNVTAAQMIDQSLSLSEEGLPDSWSVQVASFSNIENARSLRQKLRDNSYHSYIYRIQSESGELYRVFVGPVLSHTLVESLLENVRNKYKLEGRIVRYDTRDDVNLVGG